MIPTECQVLRNRNIWLATNIRVLNFDIILILWYVSECKTISSLMRRREAIIKGVLHKDIMKGARYQQWSFNAYGNKKDTYKLNPKEGLEISWTHTEKGKLWQFDTGKQTQQQKATFHLRDQILSMEGATGRRVGRNMTIWPKFLRVTTKDSKLWMSHNCPRPERTWHFERWKNKISVECNSLMDLLLYEIYDIWGVSLVNSCWPWFVGVIHIFNFFITT